MQVAQHGANAPRLVVGIGDRHAVGPVGGFGGHHRAHLFVGFDNVFANAFGDLDGQRWFAVQAGDPGAILQNPTGHRQIAQADHRVAIDLDRLVKDIVGGFEQARHLDRKAAGAVIQFAGGNQPIGPIEDLQNLDRVQAVAPQRHGVDDDFKQFITAAG